VGGFYYRRAVFIEIGEIPRKVIPLLRLVLLMLALGLVCDSSAHAQKTLLPTPVTKVASRPEVPLEKDIKVKRQELTERLAQAEQELRRLQEAGANESVNVSVSQELGTLKQIDAVLAQQQTAEAKKQQIAERIVQLEAELEEIRKRELPDSEPCSFLAWDQMQNELEALQSRRQMLESSLAAAAEAVELARQSRDAKDAALRLAREAVQANRDETKTGELEIAVSAAELESRLAAETLTLRRLNQEIEQLNKQLLEVNSGLQEEKLRHCQGNVRFAEPDLQEILVQIERQEQEIRRSIRLAESRLSWTEREWETAQRKVDDQGASAALREEVAARRLARQLVQQQLDVMNLRLGRLSAIREVWSRRARVFNEEASNDELSDWAESARQAIAQLDREKRVQILASDDIRKEMTALESRRQTLAETAAEVRPWIDSQLDLWRDYLLTNDRNLASIESSLQLLADLLSEIEGDIQHWTLAERLAGIGNQLAAVWNTELVSIDERPITVSKVVVGILLLFLGLWAARILSSILGNRLLQRFGLNEGAAAALKSLTFYALVVVFTLLALRFANVPLTVFTLLGGALAIGVGFGSQAVINNFISGLILLAERPIQVGDLVRLDDLVGNVVHIGARSTRVRTGDNLDIIVPNSRFLETNVLNFTLADDKFRSHVKVGIAYGTSTRDVTRLLIRAAEEHGLILKHPKPFVWFRDFGPDAYHFELHVWIQVKTLGERLRIESDLRYRIDQLFREGGIVIAFPQRDVHLNVTHPLDVRVQASDTSSSSGQSGLHEAA
jgi:small-conductance mechanosensitive channel